MTSIRCAKILYQWVLEDTINIKLAVAQAAVTGHVKKLIGAVLLSTELNFCMGVWHVIVDRFIQMANV
ncbi:MAG: hypothetical protein WC613_00670 [Candidatus Aenigmatarchaeota archaeon]